MQQWFRRGENSSGSLPNRLVVAAVFCALLPAQVFARQVPVAVAKVQQRDVPVWLSSLGQVRSLQSVEVRPQVDGVLQQILVAEGQQVKRGELLAMLDDRTIQAELAKASAELEVVSAQLQVARRDLQRYQDLQRTQAISAQIIDQQQAQVLQLEAGQRRVQAAMHAQQVQLSFTRISSPVDGQVGIRNVDAGNYVRPTDAMALFSVVQLDPISIEMALPQQHLPLLQQLMQQVRAGGQVPVQAFASDGGVLLGTGFLKVIDNRVGASTGTVRIKADFTNAASQLWPAQTVVAALRTAVLSQALTVPASAILQGPQGSYVWLAEQGKARSQPVELVLMQEQLAVVKGVTAGAVVVVDGQSRLQAGVALAIREPTPAQNKVGPATPAGAAPASQDQPQ